MGDETPKHRDETPEPTSKPTEETKLNDNVKRESFFDNIYNDGKAFIELITKSTIAVTALFYVFGILIVNFHLHQYGFYSLSLFRLNYVMAGVWTISTLMYYLIWMFIIVKEAHNIYKSSRDKKLLWTIVIPILGIFSMLVVGILLLRQFQVSLSWEWVFIPLLGICGVCYIIINFSITFTKTKANRLNTVLYYQVLFGLFMLLTYLYFFAQVLYPTIPAGLGGGKPQPVKMMFSQDTRNYLTDNGVNFYTTVTDSTDSTKTKLISDTLHLILYSDDDALFKKTSDKAHAYSIKRSDITLIEFLKEN